MNTGGMLFMMGSWLLILGVFVYTMIRTLFARGPKDADAPPP